MKNLLTISFVFFSFALFSQIYDITYHYSRTYRPPIDKGYDYIEAQIKESYKHTIKVFRLLHQNGKSIYNIQHVLIHGEIDNDPRRLTGFGDTYKDFNKGFYVQVADFIGRKKAVRERFEDIFDWQIESDRDTTIFGFSCNRATTLYNGDPVIAWFTESIPIMDGPLRYAGLPGLILQTETLFGITEVADIQIVNNEMEPIVIPEREEYVSFKEFLDSRTLTVKAKRPKRKE